MLAQPRAGTVLVIFGICLIVRSEMAFAINKQRPKIVLAPTTYGPVEGQLFVGENGFEVQGFLGIRFAKPPIDDLRFKPPQPPDRWIKPAQAKTWPKRCVQTNIFHTTRENITSKEDEDCLFLNVFAPYVKESRQQANGSENSDYPVMVCIHGGGFYFGSTERYGYQGIVKRIVPKGVVMVTIQYRLGAFGFLSTGDSEVPGNVGLLDQTLALKWIRENIQNFNGDPDRVTVFGESAGGGATSLLTLSPLSRDLFHQAITMSGAATAAWVLSEQAPIITKRIAKLLHCDVANSEELVRCLQEKDAQEIVNATLMNTDQSIERFGLEFSAVIDGHFLPKPIKELYQEAAPKRLLTGVVANEANVFVMPIAEHFALKWSISKPSHFTRQNFTNALDELIAKDRYKSAELLRTIGQNYYLDYHGDTTNTTFLISQFMELFGDVTIYVPQFEDAVTRISHGWEVYAYIYDYYNSAIFPTGYKFKGAGHAMEMSYLLETPIWTSPPLTLTPEEEEIAEALATIWTNFAKFGDPTISDSKDEPWNPMMSQSQDSTNYFRIGLRSTSEPTGWLRESTAFWSKLVPEIEENFFECKPIAN